MIRIGTQHISLFRAASPEALRQALAQNRVASAPIAAGDAAVALVWSSPIEFAEQRRRAQLLLGGDTAADGEAAGIFLTHRAFGAQSLAFVYPGQGAQYAGMFADYAGIAAFDHAASEIDALAQPVFGRSLRAWMSGEGEDGALTGTLAAQGTLGFVAAALTRTLAAYGVQAPLCAGHSYGELPALHAAGAIDTATLLHLSQRRGSLMAQAATLAPGGMAAIGVNAAQASQLIAGIAGIEIANLNTHKQTVIAGDLAGLQTLADRCAAQRLPYKKLNTAAAFHTSRMAQAAQPWRDFVAQCAANGALQAPKQARVIANVSATDYPADAAVCADLLAKQMTQTVRWAECCERLHEAGARVFLELGPGEVLTRTLKHNLGERPHLAIACDPRGSALAGNGERHFAQLLARLAVQGVALREPINQKPLSPAAPSRAATAVHATRGTAMLTSPLLAAGEPSADSSNDLIRGFFSENGRLLERYFGLATRLIDSVATPPAEVLLRLLDQSARLTSDYLSAHERVMLASGASLSLTAEGRSLIPALPVPVTLPVAQPLSPVYAKAASEPLRAAEPASTYRVTPAVPVAATASLSDWLRGEVASVTGFPAASIDLDASFDDMGIDSLAFTDLFSRLAERVPTAKDKAGDLFGARSLRAVLKVLGEDVAPVAESAAESAAGSVVENAQSLEAWLREQVSQVTGFPIASIDSRASFEDMGIDSLAFTDLFSRLAERAPQAKDKVSELFGARSIAAVVAVLKGAADVIAAEAEAAASEIIAKDSRSPALNTLRDALLSKLNELRPEAGTLSEDSSLEALKLSAFETEALWREAGADRPPWSLAGESLMSARTPREALELLAALEPAPSNEPTSPTDSLIRYLRREIERELPPPAALPSQLLLIGAEGEALARSHAQLAEAGVQLHTLSLGPQGWSSGEGDSIALDDHRALAERLRQLRTEAKQLPIVFMTPREPSLLDATSETEWMARVDRNAVGLFTLAKALDGAADAQRAHGRLYVLLSSGASPADVAARGVARCLSHEWRKAPLAVSSLVMEDGATLLNALRVLQAHPGAHDLVLRGSRLFDQIAHQQATRCTQTIAGEQAPLPLQAGSVVLLFGGGVGIGAEVGCDLARRYRSRIVALGRTAWDGNDPYPEAKTDAALGEAVFQQLSILGGKKPAPAELQKALQLARRQRALLSTAQRVREAGGEFEYRQADVTKQADVERAIAAIRQQHGAIDVVVHAAGVLEDQRVASKSVESFRRVVHTKARSAYLLLQALKDAPPRFIAFFSSLVAHSGNAGQTDYCAANEVLNAMARDWARDKAGSRVVSFLWSVWTETGLAGRGVQGFMERHGLAGVSSADGIRYFHSELAQPEARDWVLITSPRTLEVMRQGLLG